MAVGLNAVFARGPTRGQLLKGKVGKGRGGPGQGPSEGQMCQELSGQRDHWARPGWPGSGLSSARSGRADLTDPPRGQPSVNPQSPRGRRPESRQLQGGVLSSLSQCRPLLRRTLAPSQHQYPRHSPVESQSPPNASTAQVLTCAFGGSKFPSLASGRREQSNGGDQLHARRRTLQASIRRDCHR